MVRRPAAGSLLAFAPQKMVGSATRIGMAADDADELARVRRERDLYRRVLDLGRQDEPEPFLREALGLIVEVTGARHGYLELHDEDHTGTPRWALAHGFTAEQLAGVRAAISGGIIAEAVATGKTIVTPSALLDERRRAASSTSRTAPGTASSPRMTGCAPRPSPATWPRSSTASSPVSASAPAWTRPRGCAPRSARPTSSAAARPWPRRSI